MTPILGYLGGVAFALCAMPQAWKVYRNGHATELSAWFLGLWFFGEVCCIAETVRSLDACPWLLGNYLVNFACLVVLLRYKIFPRYRT
jgi:hypothetical protein